MTRDTAKRKGLHAAAGGRSKKCDRQTGTEECPTLNKFVKRAVIPGFFKREEVPTHRFSDIALSVKVDGGKARLEWISYLFGSFKEETRCLAEWDGRVLRVFRPPEFREDGDPGSKLVQSGLYMLLGINAILRRAIEFVHGKAKWESLAEAAPDLSCGGRIAWVPANSLAVNEILLLDHPFVCDVVETRIVEPDITLAFLRSERHASVLLRILKIFGGPVRQDLRAEVAKKALALRLEEASAQAGG